MMRRALPRALAVGALLAAGLAVYLILQGAASSTGSSSTATTRSTKARPPGPGRTAAGRTAPRGRGPKFYVVRSGDTLSKIALRTKVSVAALQELNPNLNPTSLQTGQRIKLR